MANDKYRSSHFNQAPSIVSKQKRTRFDIGGVRRFTCNTGDWVPFYCEEVYPGDTFDLRTSTLTRLETSLHQTMDNAYLELAYFYVPNRIVFDKWDQLLGANPDAWAREIAVNTPQIFLAGDSDIQPFVRPQSLLNFLMLPVDQYPSDEDLVNATEGDINYSKLLDAMSVTALPMRACFQIWNDWFRDENYDSEIYFDKSINNYYLTDLQFLLNGSYFYPYASTLKVNRHRDRFSSVLPAPQKGQPVSFNLGSLAPLTIGDSYKLGTAGNYDVLFDNINFNDDSSATDIEGDIQTGDDSERQSYSTLYADLTNATAVTINDLRLAIAAQVLSEQEARGGTRLTEVLFTQWNINAPSLMMDRSEYLGGRSIPLQMLEVLQTSQTTESAVLGEDAGHSKTLDTESGGFLKSFMFHGYIIGVAFIRTARSYSQGIDRKFFRSDKYSYYNPIFDNIGEVPVYSKELFAINSLVEDPEAVFETVFGYQEAWYELKECMNRDSGYMQTGISGTLDTWHYGDEYDDVPVSSFSWLKEDKDRVDRTIAVQSSASGFQWSLFINVECYATRQMHKYSIPNAFGFGNR